MSIRLINNGLGPSGSNYGRTVCNIGSKTLFSRRGIEDNNVGFNFSPSGENARMDPNYTSWSSSTGYVVGTAGTVMFDSEVFGGSLSELIAINRGTGNVFVGVNSLTPAVSSGLMLSSGESYKFQDGVINRFWGITQFGTVVVQAYGPRYFNSNTI